MNIWLIAFRKPQENHPIFPEKEYFFKIVGKDKPIFTAVIY